MIPETLLVENLLWNDLQNPPQWVAAELVVLEAGSIGDVLEFLTFEITINVCRISQFRRILYHRTWRAVSRCAERLMIYDIGPLPHMRIECLGIHANIFERLPMEENANFSFEDLSNHPPKRYAG
jgi:hypothetical protein